MKKLIKKLPLVGFILAIGAAFAFNSNSSLDTAWFELDPTTGEPVGQALPAEPDCIENQQVYCSGEYTVDAQGEPQGSALQEKMGEYVSQ